MSLATHLTLKFLNNCDLFGQFKQALHDIYMQFFRLGLFWRAKSLLSHLSLNIIWLKECASLQTNQLVIDEFDEWIDVIEVRVSNIFDKVLLKHSLANLNWDRIHWKNGSDIIVVVGLSFLELQYCLKILANLLIFIVRMKRYIDSHNRPLKIISC